MSRGAVLAHLLRLMPNVRTVSLSNPFLGWDFLNLLPKLLGANRLITELVFNGDENGSGEWRALIRQCSATVEVLRLYHCSSDFSHRAYEAIGDCTELRHLFIDGTPSFSDDLMKKILLNNPRLEALEIL